MRNKIINSKYKTKKEWDLTNQISIKTLMRILFNLNSWQEVMRDIKKSERRP